MRDHPTFDQIAYTPDVGECLTIPQAMALLHRSRQSAEALARRIADELIRRNLAPVDAASPLVLRTPADLVESQGRTRDADWLTIGTVNFHTPIIGSHVSIALQWWWQDDGLRVGWWLVRPAPAWDR